MKLTDDNNSLGKLLIGHGRAFATTSMRQELNQRQLRCVEVSNEQEVVKLSPTQGNRMSGFRSHFYMLTDLETN